ncbi:hypothetical protein [uncultured Kordia sp.]|uniref:hypothetical protein n=1 Tax=uncultured Kordia sp. TaxID=507699 RepID=UPI002604E3B3|nr:hypothetical protein [uncultured Kordia sp.]
MQRTFLVLFFLISSHVFGQRDLEVRIDDFNNDKIIDTLKTFYEGGSGFGGQYVQIVNGKTNEMFQLTNNGCFCEIKNTMLVSPKLAKKENAPFLEIMKAHILPKKRKHPEGSLNWIIKSAHSNVFLDNNAIFDFIADPQNDWIEGEFEAPDNYYIEIKGDTLRQLYATPYNVPEWLHEKDTKGFLVYYAHNHYRSKTRDSIKLSDSNALYKVFNTSHGVYVQKGNAYKWVFISDIAITGAPSKLRWESIKQTKLFGKYLLVQQNFPLIESSELYVINIETGICGQLKYNAPDFDITIEDLFKDETISNHTKEKQIKHTLKTIFEELEKQYLTKK